MNLPQEFSELLGECAALIDDSGLIEADHRLPSAEPLPSLLAQTQKITEQVCEAVEAVRVVTHFACSGGTLIAKCVASMPNTTVLSEVAPHSRVVDVVERNRFFPTDLIQLCRLSAYPDSSELECRIFQSGLRMIHADASRKGLFLVLRDHAHSKYCVGASVDSTPTLRQEVSGCLPTKTVVTVRHPLDSFLSLINNDWLHFSPGTLDEYCRRYMAFLDDHADYPLFKYEAFINDPLSVGKAICEALDLPFNDQFRDIFGVHVLSGDSGRRSNTIARRSRRAVPEGIQVAVKSSEAYERLCDRLQYTQAVSSQDD